MPRKTCVALLALVVLAVPAAAGAATPETSSNWAGYAVTKNGLKYRHVTATWVQPAADCSQASGTYSAYWVGLGGFSSSSQALEQIGTDADCTSGGAAKYTAWYELVPSAAVDITGLAIRPGDRLSASVDVRGHVVTVHLANLTKGKTFRRTVSASRVDTSSAEWIVEAPALCDGQLQVCETQPLANFGTATFSNARATTALGHTGAIADPAWHVTAISLSGSGGGGDFGPRRRFGPQAAAASATPSSLSASGASFTVSYAAAAAGGPPNF